jgi:hypothetical protein
LLNKEENYLIRLNFLINQKNIYTKYISSKI